MREVTDIIESWSGGVITTLEADAIPKTSSPRGWNTLLSSVGGEAAVPEKRRGVKVRNRTAITGNPVIFGQKQFIHVLAGVRTLYDILVTDNGRVERLNSDDTLTNITTGLTGGAPDFAQAKNMLLFLNGAYKKKLLVITGALTLQDIGIPRPAVATLSSPNAGGMTGTYEIAITEVNNNAAVNESSLSDSASVTVTAKKITITRPTLATQSTHWRIYIRKTSQSSIFKRDTFTVTGYDATVQGWTAATSAVEIDLTDLNLAALTIAAPSTKQNEPPPAGVKFATWHNNRMFLADEENVYYSNEGLPEAFDTDSVEPVNPQDGQKITGMVSLGAGENALLLILKENSGWGITGDDPKTWLKEKVVEIGTSSHRSIVVDPSGVAYWWSPQIGPIAWVRGSEPIDIGKTLIEKTISEDVLNFAQNGSVAASLFTKNNLILFSASERNQEGEPSSTKNNIILPFNYKVKRWVSDRWNPLDAASLAIFEDANGNPKVHLGGYFGQTFRLWDGDNDGIFTGTTRGSVTSATTNSITDTAAAFDTVGAGLKGRYLYVIDPSGNVQRRRIGTNTGTALTLDGSLTFSVTPNNNYTYVVGGIQWEWDLYWSLFQNPFMKKRIIFMYAQFKTPVAATKVTIDIFRNYSSSPTKSITVTVNPGGAIWDSSLWDQSRWAAEAAQNFRKRVGLSAIAIKLRFRNLNPDEPLILLKAGYDGELLSDKIG